MSLARTAERHKKAQPTRLMRIEFEAALTRSDAAVHVNNFPPPLRTPVATSDCKPE